MSVHIKESPTSVTSRCLAVLKHEYETEVLKSKGDAPLLKAKKKKMKLFLLLDVFFHDFCTNKNDVKCNFVFRHKTYETRAL